MKRTYIAIMAISLLMTTGCAEVVELTEDETAKIVQYATTSTLKYDEKYNKKIVKISEEEVNEEVKEEVKEEPAEEEKTIEENTKEASSENEIIEESEAIEEQKEDVPSDLASILGISSASIIYNGCEVVEQYPEESEKYTEKSSDNTKLLVLKFNITNMSGNGNLIELLSLSPKFIAKINSDNRIKSLESPLEEDMTTLCEEMSADSVMEKVLLFEIDNETAEMINTIDLEISVNGALTSINLQ